MQEYYDTKWYLLLKYLCYRGIYCLYPQDKGEKYFEMLVNFTKLYGFTFLKRKILSRFYFFIIDCLCIQTFLALPSSLFVLALLCNNSVSTTLGQESPEINTIARYVLHVSSLYSKEISSSSSSSGRYFNETSAPPRYTQ